MELVDVIAAETVAAEAALAAAESQLAALREMAVLAARLGGAAPESPKAPASSQRRTRERSGPKRETRRAAAQQNGGHSAEEFRRLTAEAVTRAGANGIPQVDLALELGAPIDRVKRALDAIGDEVRRDGARVGRNGGRSSPVWKLARYVAEPVPSPGRQPSQPQTLDGRVLVSLIAPKYGAEVANELGVTIGELSPVLERLKDEGEVRRCEGGKWEAVR